MIYFLETIFIQRINLFCFNLKENNKHIYGMLMITLLNFSLNLCIQHNGGIDSNLSSRIISEIVM